MKVSKVVSIGLLVALTVAISVGIAWQGQKSLPQVVIGGSQGVTNFDSMHLSDTGGTATPVLRANQAGTGKIVEFLDGGTPVWSLNDGGEVQSSGALALNGQKLDLDADDDTSLTADTDDQIDLEIGGGDVFVFKEFGTTTIETTTTTRLLEILDTTPVMSDNTNSMIGLNIDLGIGNSTGGTNSVYGVYVDGITADAENTETAVGIGSGWDAGIDAGTNTIVNIGNAGTDFDSNGGLTTAVTVTITSGGLDITDGDITLADDFIIEAQTAISVTDGSTITPTGTYQQLESAAEVTGTLTTSGLTTGTTYEFIVTSNTTINIADTGVQRLAGAWAGGQYDVLAVRWDGTNWIERYRSDN